MSDDWRSDASLPEQVRHTLGRLCEALFKELGEELFAVVLHGPVAKGDVFHAPTTSVDLLLVLSNTNVANLEAIGPQLTRAQLDLRVKARIMTASELTSSADVFPLTYVDMLEHHRVLHGNDPFAEVEVQSDHMRLRCEQELKELLLDLRMRVLRTASNPRKLIETLAELGSAFIDTLGGLLRLRTGSTPALRADVVQAVGDQGVDLILLQELLAIDSGRYTPTPSEAKAVADRLLRAVAAAAHVADQHESEE